MAVHRDLPRCSLPGWRVMLLLMYGAKKNPGVREYSCHSETHKTLSRIDFLLSMADGLPFISNIRYLPRAISDHSPIEVTLNLHVGQGKNTGA